MVCLFVAATVATGWAEQAGNPLLSRTAVQQPPTENQPGGNMEGKETRFGICGSVLTEVVTANTATGSVNSAPDSYAPIGGMVALVGLLLGEIVFGGLGTGLYSLILIVLLTLFITGLMVGRTPEYVGKKIGPPDAYASALANNGQAFAGMSVNSPFWNSTTVLAMLVGRLGLGVAALALALGPIVEHLKMVAQA